MYKSCICAGGKRTDRKYCGYGRCLLFALIQHTPYIHRRILIPVYSLTLPYVVAQLLNVQHQSLDVPQAHSTLHNWLLLIRWLDIAAYWTLSLLVIRFARYLVAF